MGDCKSLGSNCLHGSQSRKVSIGIMAEDLANVRSGARKEGGSLLPDTKKVTHSRGKLVEERCKGSQSVVSAERKQAEAQEQDVSPWMGTRSLPREVMMPKKDLLQSGDRNEGGALCTKKATGSGVILVEERLKGSKSVVSSKRKQAEPPEQDASPWMGTRSLPREVMTTKKDLFDSGDRKEGGALLLDIKKATRPGGKLAEENCIGSGSVVPSEGKQAEAPGQGASPWVYTRSLRQEVMMRKNDHLRTTPKNRANIISETPVPETVQFYTNRTSILHSEDGVQRKFDSVVHGRARQKDGNTERVEAFAFAAAEEVHVSGKGAEEEKSDNRSNEALRIKLSEILGTDASPNADNLSTQPPESEIKDSKPEQSFNQRGSKASKPRQNSDTIETDSESPNGTTRRPMTRSLTRKTRTTGQPQFNHKLNTGGKESPLLTYKRRRQETNTFSFDEAEGWMGRHQKTDDGSSSAATCKKYEMKSSGLAQRKIHFSAKGKLRKSGQDTQGSKSAAAARRITSHSNSTKVFHSHPPHPTRKHLQPSDENLEEFHPSPEIKKRDQEQNLNSLSLTGKENSQGYFYTSPSKKNENSRYDVNSPTFRMGTPTKTSTPTSSSPKSKSVECGVNSPVSAERRSPEEGFRTCRTSFTSKLASVGYNIQTELSDDTTELEQSPAKELLHVTEKNRSEDRPSQPPSEQDTDSSEDDLPIKKGCRTTETWKPKIVNLGKSPFILHRSKRLRCQVKEESIQIMGSSDKSEEDDLPRAVALLASALERFKTKMNSHTSKKSSEILTNVADGVQLQLRNVEYQIQTDVGEFTSLAKSKRKSTEARFVEQQERLKLLREKFKKEVNQHLQDLRSTLEELEVYQRELEGNAEKQNTLHRKLLLQAEKEVAAQLSDAEKRITTVHKVANEKMYQLKHVIMECLKDGVFS